MDILERLRGYNPPDRTTLGSRRVAEDIQDAATEIEQLRSLVRAMIENDPEDMAADGVTVLAAWRQRAMEIVDPAN